MKCELCDEWVDGLIHLAATTWSPLCSVHGRQFGQACDKTPEWSEYLKNQATYQTAVQRGDEARAVYATEQVRLNRQALRTWVDKWLAEQKAKVTDDKAETTA